MSRLFGTDGIRGVVNESLTPELAYHLGRAAAYYFGREKEHPVFLIGRDTRRSGTMLEAALAAGICSVGGNVIHLGIVPTPAVAYLTKKHQYEAGIMISASHNPFQDNGIKFFDHNGFKLPDATEDELEQILLQDSRGELDARPTGAGIGAVEIRPELRDEYIDFICSTTDVRLDGLRIVHDAANGSASQVGPEIFRRLGASVVSIHNQPNGININDHCGSTHMESLKETVLQTKAQIGIANDGDADRCLIVDELGREMDGDQIMFLCAKDLKEQGRLKKDTVVGTVMSNIGFHKAVAAIGCQTVTTGVGDRYVLERMLQDGYCLGGEQSGHVIFLDHNTTGDGILTAVQILALLKKKGCPLSELAGEMKKYPQKLVNVRVTSQLGWEKHSLIMAAIAAGEAELGEEGRILVRASGTEPLIRVMAEGPDQEELDRITQDIAAVIEREIGI